MTDTENVLSRIDGILGFTDDMTIEWDASTSSDAMRSRPADAIPPRKLGRGIDYAIYDEAAEWFAMFARLDPDHPELAAIRRDRPTPGPHLHFDRPEGEQ